MNHVIYLKLRRKKTVVKDEQFHIMTIEITNNKARHNPIDAKWRWRSNRLDGAGSFWSNASDQNPPEGDTKPPGGDNP